MPRIDPFFEMPCPQCGELIVFVVRMLKVRCESKGEVDAGDFWQLWQGCSNPFCEWSKIQEGNINGRR